MEETQTGEYVYYGDTGEEATSKVPKTIKTYMWWEVFR